VAGKNKKWKNPFYALLIPSGAVFCVTAFAYGFMAFQQVNAGRSSAMQNAAHPLHTWLSEHGSNAILIELAVLAVLTIGTITTDSWWAGDDNDSV
jgi:hypothetical protein